MALIDTHVHFEIGDYPIIPSYEEQYGTEKARVVREKNAEMKRRWQQAWHFPIPFAAGCGLPRYSAEMVGANGPPSFRTAGVYHLRYQ